MVSGKAMACVMTLAGIALLTAALPVDLDPRADFGTIDPSYRSIHPDTAWFVRQPGDTSSPADDPELAPPADPRPITLLATLSAH